jgi:hypothetical protein
MTVESSHPRSKTIVIQHGLTHSAPMSDVKQGASTGIAKNVILRTFVKQKLTLKSLNIISVFALTLFITCNLQANRPANYQLNQDWLISPQSFETTFSVNDGKETIELSNGLIRRVWQITPNAATIALDNLMTGESMLRSVRPEALIELDGLSIPIGGLSGQPNHAYLTPEWLETMKSWPNSFEFTGYETGEPEERFPWKRVRHHAPGAQWPPKGKSLKLHFKPPSPSYENTKLSEWLKNIQITICYEMYDGIPALSKWLIVKNNDQTTHNVDRFKAEILAIVPYEDPVEFREGVAIQSPNIHAETDYAFGGFSVKNSTRFSIHWKPDPLFNTQVNYLKMNPCLLEASPDIGPDQTLQPGSQFESFRVFEMLFDTTERYRKGLSLRKLYRVIAPWVTENPLILHLTTSDESKIRQAIDQAADCGFEIVNLSFGSGLSMENNSQAYLDQFKQLANYAHSKGIEMGGYSLLSSRRIQPDSDNAIHPDTGKPGGQTHGYAPALASEWGQNYFRKLTLFFEQTGFTKFVHDGSYPGDLDASERLPLQKGVKDSRWVQWRIITDFYKWMRSEGYYLRVPDYYYLSGANEAGMGYREVNWSLPRIQQQIHTRQNIFDGSIEKTPSMGWMFVPLTQYHGGGEAATIEPLKDHIDHYENMLVSNLGAGVQAVYRGHRLYDSENVRNKVRNWIDWYKQYRNILESDIIHSSSKRANGHSPDWVFHANPKTLQKGIWVSFNPLTTNVHQEIKLNIYYTGLNGTARIIPEGNRNKAFKVTIDQYHSITIPMAWKTKGIRWLTIE